MNYDPLYHPYASRRSLVYGTRGMVATSQPLAAQAGLDMLKKRRQCGRCCNRHSGLPDSSGTFRQWHRQ